MKKFDKDFNIIECKLYDKDCGSMCIHFDTCKLANPKFKKGFIFR